MGFSLRWTGFWAIRPVGISAFRDLKRETWGTQGRANRRGAEEQILRPAYPTSWGPKRAGSQDDMAWACRELGTTGNIASRIVGALDVLKPRTQHEGGLL
jgi:hypothetical protein